MIVYRFAHPKYADDISGAGAKITGGRWNSPGYTVLYTSEHISLALLEVLVNAGSLEQLQVIKLLEIEIPPQAPAQEIKLSQLKKDWWADYDYTQWIGNEVIKTATSLFVRCPSAVVNTEHNILLNPAHPSFKKVRVKTKTDFHFDERLFKTAIK
jgi:RES domain-containing protein